MAAAAYAPHPRNHAMAEMNVTPLVDVMLVLLVIFMITAPAITRALPMNLPQPGPETRPAPPAQMHLRVGSTGAFVLDGRPLNADELRSALADAARLKPDAVLHVAAAQDTEYQGFATALEAAQGSGIENIALDE
ncbi:ExbD/TolR family protein [Cognatilysobacter lacus]|uniref:Biopolymer transporter ExbD n=1 Tax=Cognatilysobacter lacus TaxID=1643323 RepID=A0A5D8Z540_9GAMM|nr:biopolymer transporter ExbD [Lysobacter lacus]TZF89859.1 biopolymer transporter ExbD [Lysobacter lacus]